MSAKILNVTDIIKYRKAKEYAAEVGPALQALGDAYQAIFPLYQKYPEFHDLVVAYHENLPYITFCVKEVIREIEDVEGEL